MDECRSSATAQCSLCSTDDSLRGVAEDHLLHGCSLVQLFEALVRVEVVQNARDTALPLHWTHA